MALKDKLTSTKTSSTQSPGELSQIDEPYLNQAATDLLFQLPDHAGQLAHSLARQTQVPIWQVVGGMLLTLHLEGRMSEFRIDPAWKEGLKTKELVCKFCGKSFNPRHIGQPYCSNPCGLAADNKKTKKPEGTSHASHAVHAKPTPKLKLSSDDSSKSGNNSTWAEDILPPEAA